MASLVQNTNGPVLAYLLLSQAAVQVAGPYFTPFMLGHLALSYYHYVILICAASLARIVLLPAWGRVVDRYGPQRVLWLSAIGIIPLPALWLLSRSFAAPDRRPGAARAWFGRPTTWPRCCCSLRRFPVKNASAC